MIVLALSETSIELGRFFMFTLGAFVMGGALMLGYRSYVARNRVGNGVEREWIRYHTWISICLFFAGLSLMLAGWIGRFVAVTGLSWLGAVSLSAGLRALYIGTKLASPKK